jgi:hypothetical protein
VRTHRLVIDGKISVTATGPMPHNLLITSIIAAVACYNASSAPITQVVGTWGGDNAGLIASDTGAHIHIGCTLGDTKTSIHPDADGHFDVVGTYNVDAYPVDRGIIHPARFSGQITGHTMTLTVNLTDTARQLGPVTLTYGKEPKMGPCPICRKPKHAGRRTLHKNHGLARRTRALPEVVPSRRGTDGPRSVSPVASQLA